jgi:molybdate transport system substrate-binding protein
MPLNVLSAGAAKGLVDALAHRVAGGIAGSFGAVGTIRGQLLAGSACDVRILTAKMLDELAAAGRVVRDSIAPLGRVHTGIAVPTAGAHPAIGDRAALAAALAAATTLYCPDTERATAGIHFVRVLRELGLYADLAPRLRTYPSGALAMRALADAGDPLALGCTQVTEIRYTPGVALAGLLPAEFELATVYAAGVATAASDAPAARAFVALLSGPETLPLRREGGFVPC